MAENGDAKSITVKCPHCGVELEVPPGGLGRVHQCQCGERFRAPGARPNRPLSFPRAALGRLGPKWSAALGALLLVAVLLASQDLLRSIRLWYVLRDLEAPIMAGPRPKSLDELLADMTSGDQTARQAATRRLAEQGAAAIGPLIGLLASEDRYVSGAAREALVRIGPPAVPALIAALEEGNARAATASAMALGEIGDPRAVKPLRATVERYVKSMGRQPSPARGATPLPSVLPRTVSRTEPETDTAHDRGNAAACAVVALGDLHATEAAETLLMAAGVGGGILDRAIATALEKMGGEVLPMLRQHLWDVGPEGREIIITVSADLGQPLPDQDLARLLGAEDEGVALAAARTLVARGDRRALAVLIGIVKDPESVNGGTAIDLLGELGDTRAVPAIISALAHQSNYVREAAAEALGKLGHRDAVEPLMAALGDESESVARKAAHSLGQLGDRRAVAALEAVLDSGRHWVYDEAAKALVAIAGAEMVPTFIEDLASSHVSTYNAARDALGELGAPAAPALVAALSDEREQVRKGAIDALCYMNVAAVDALLAGLDNAEGEALENMLTLLRSCSDEPRVREAIRSHGGGPRRVGSTPR